MSASDALFAYLQQFNRKTRTKQQQDAYELLVARSKMASRRSRSLESEVKDSIQALRQRKIKQLMSKKKNEQTGLRREGRVLCFQQFFITNLVLTCINL